MKYQTRPEQVEAFQWFKHGDHTAVTKCIPYEYDKNHQIIKGLGSNCYYHEFVAPSEIPICGYIPTQFGSKIIRPGDWIVIDAKGNISVYTDEDFVVTFERERRIAHHWQR